MLIFLTGHEIRTGKTLRAQSVFALAGSHRWIISGTPIQNRWEDLASLLKFLRAYPDHDIRQLTRLLKQNKSTSNIGQMLASICLRRSKKAVELPTRTDKVHRVEFDFDDRASYNKARDKVIHHLQWGVESTELNEYANILAKMNALRHMCNLGAHYRPSSSFNETRGVQDGALQQLFESMTSTGVAICSRCGEGLLDSDNSGLAADMDNSSPRYHLTLCGFLTCAACSALAKDRVSLDVTDCVHGTSCPSGRVSVPKESDTLSTSCSNELPVKMR